MKIELGIHRGRYVRVRSVEHGTCLNIILIVYGCIDLKSWANKLGPSQDIAKLVRYNMKGW